MIRRPSMILCALVAVGAGLAAQGRGSAPPPPPQAQQPTFRARVDSVSVDATVTDKTASRSRI
jgi:hypothetical protein